MLKKHDIGNRNKKTTTINSILGSRDVLSNVESNENNKDHPQVTYNRDKEVINNYYRNIKKYEKLGIFEKFILEYKILFIILCFFVFVFLGFLIAVIILAVKYRYEKNHKCEGCYIPNYNNTCPIQICSDTVIKGNGGNIKITLIDDINDNDFELFSPYYLFDSSTSTPVNITGLNFYKKIDENWDGYINKISGPLTVNFKDIITQSGYRMFYNNQYIKEIDFSDFNLDYLTNTEQMFYNMTNLEKITGLDKINTLNIRSMEQMFYNCKKLDFSNLFKMDIKNVTSTKKMFYNCAKLTSIDLSNQNASKLIDMENMFENSGIKNVNMRNFTAPKLVSMSNMFLECSNLTSLDISSLNAPNLRKIDDIFKNSSLYYIDMSNWSNINIGEKINLDYIFKDCTSLNTVNFNNYKTIGDFTFGNFVSDISTLENFNFKNNYISGSLNGEKAFSNCNNLKSLEFSTIEIKKEFNFKYFLSTVEEILFSNISIEGKIEGNFNGASKIGSIIFRDINSSSGAIFSYMFSGVKNVSYVTFDNIFVKNSLMMNYMFSADTNGINHEFLNLKTDTGNINMDCLYSGIKMNTLNITNIYVGNEFSMSQFIKNSVILNIILSKLNIQKRTTIRTMAGNNITNMILYDSTFIGVTDFSHIFVGGTIVNFYANNLTFINDLYFAFQLNTFYNFTMQNIKAGANLNFKEFFKEADVTETAFQNHIIEFSNIQASQKVDLSYMFSGLKSTVKNINFTSSNFNSIDTMESMFNGLSELLSVDFSGSNFNEISVLTDMFYGCTNLISLDLSNFNNKINSDMKNMFYGCENLLDLNIFNFKSDINKTDGMFTNVNSNCYICINDNEQFIHQEAIKTNPSIKINSDCQNNNLPLSNNA